MQPEGEKQTQQQEAESEPEPGAPGPVTPTKNQLSKPRSWGEQVSEKGLCVVGLHLDGV